MKIYVLSFVLFIIYSFNAFGQSNPFFETKLNEVTSEIRLQGTNNIVDLHSIKGSPYEKEEFLIGKTISELTNISNPYYLRYNIYSDNIELKSNGTIYSLIQSQNIYAIFDSKEYRYEQYKTTNKNTKLGYFIILVKDKKYNLYLKKNIEFRDKVKANTPYESDTPATFLKSSSFYVKKDSVLISIPNKKKLFLQEFPKYSNSLKKYIKSERINLKYEKDMVKLFNYLNTL